MTLGLSDWSSIAQIGSVVGAVLIGLWRVWRKIDTHQANSAARSAVLETRLDNIQAQFGPNGGGLREAVNRISDAISHMDRKLDGMNGELSQLKGEFKQHVRDNHE